MSKLQAELTIGVVSEADVDAARSNVDEMEREVGVDSDHEETQVM